MLTMVRLIHQTPKRLRFTCKYLLGEDNARQLGHEIKQHLGVSAVRINPKIGSVVFEGEALDTMLIQNTLISLDIKQYQTCHTFLDSCFDDTEEAPSISGIMRAGSALVVQPFVPTNNAKMALGTAASLSLLRDGVKELFEEGLTSKV